MKRLGRIIPSFFASTAPTTDSSLLRLLGSRSTDKQFAKRVRDVILSREALVAAGSLSPRDAQKVINKLDKALDNAAIVENKKLWRGCLRYLCKICGHHRLLPVTYKLTSAWRTGDRPIDSGGFGEVWRGVYNGQQVAIKVLKVYETTKIEEIGKRFCREVLMWSRRAHPNILPLIGVLDKGFAMVSEWMENGNIRQFILAHPDANRPFLLLGATDGLIYLHSQNLVHGDLKGGNILIKQDGTSCLADFGLATIASTETSTFSSSPSTGGTIRWMSPELLNPDEYNGPPGRTVHSDRYAFGMVIYEVLTGNIPFHLLSNTAVIVQVAQGVRPRIPGNISTDPSHKSGLWAIVQECWQKKPVDRPALSDVRQRLSAAAGMWVVDLNQSGWDGYVNVPINALLSSMEYSDPGGESELEQRMSPFLLIQHSLPGSTPERAATPASVHRGRFRTESPHHSSTARLRSSSGIPAQVRYDPSHSSQPRTPEGLWGSQHQLNGSKQSLAVPAQSVGRVQRDSHSSNSEWESDQEVPPFVYAEKESLFVGPSS